MKHWISPIRRALPVGIYFTSQWQNNVKDRTVTINHELLFHFMMTHFWVNESFRHDQQTCTMIRKWNHEAQRSPSPIVHYPDSDTCVLGWQIEIVRTCSEEMETPAGVSEISTAWGTLADRRQWNPWTLISWRLEDEHFKKPCLWGLSHFMQS